MSLARSSLKPRQTNPKLRQLTRRLDKAAKAAIVQAKAAQPRLVRHDRLFWQTEDTITIVLDKTTGLVSKF